MKKIDYSDKLLDSICKKRDVDSLAKVIHLIDNSSLLNKFIELPKYRHFIEDKNLLDCLFQVIDRINIAKFGNILLNSSSRHGCLEYVKYLIEGGVNLHYRNDIVLSCAQLCRHHEVYEYLVKNGADIYSGNFNLNKLDTYGHCPMPVGIIEELDYLFN
jgi:hypothetical protein